MKMTPHWLLIAVSVLGADAMEMSMMDWVPFSSVVNLMAGESEFETPKVTAGPIVQKAAMLASDVKHLQQGVAQVVSQQLPVVVVQPIQPKNAIAIAPQQPTILPVQQSQQMLAQQQAQPTPVPHVAIGNVSMVAVVAIAKMQETNSTLADLESQLASKIKELAVQASLEKEKAEQTDAAEKKVQPIRKRAEELQKEADVAATIAREKSEQAAKATKERVEEDKQVHNLELQKTETDKFLKQTTAEEVVLEQQLKALRGTASPTHDVINAQAAPQFKRGNMLTKVVTAFPQAVSSLTAKAQPEAVAVAIRQILPSAAATRPAVVGAASSKQFRAFSSPTVAPQVAIPNVATNFQKLKAENELLKQEKVELERQLVDRKNADEKEHLRRRLKSKLVEADHRVEKR